MVTEQLTLSPEQDAAEDREQRDEREKALEEKIKTPEIRELYWPMAKLLGELRPVLEEHEYSSLLGDDVAGRIPALIIRRVVNEVYRRDGGKEIPCFFVKGGLRLLHRERGAESRKAVSEYLDRIREKLGDRSLIVTEYVHSGVSEDTLVKLLRKKGVAADVATLYDVGAPEETERRYGGWHGRGGRFLGNADLYVGESGVRKTGLGVYGVSVDYSLDESSLGLSEYNEVRKDKLRALTKSILSGIESGEAGEATARRFIPPSVEEFEMFLRKKGILAQPLSEEEREYLMIYGEEGRGQYLRRGQTPPQFELSEEERKEYENWRERLVQAREDIKTLSDLLVQEYYGEFMG